MKTLLIMILTSLLIGTQIFNPQLLVSADSIDLLTSKKIYFPGETIQIIGHFLPNVVIHIDLVNPLDNSKNSTQVQTDDTGRFQKNILIPNNAVNGTWKILASSGTRVLNVDISIISSNYNKQNETTPVVTMCCGKPISLGPPLPLKQFKSGIAIKDIQCKQDLLLVIRSGDGSPVCVKPDTAQKLVQRGWGMSLNSANGINIIAEPIACHIPRKVLDAIGHSFKIPRILPAGYSIQDGDLFYNKLLHLYYAKGPLCGNPQNQTKNGVIHFLAEKLSNGTIDWSSKPFEDMKKNSQRGNLMSLFEINGNPAIGWESGMKNNIAIWDNGTILSKTRATYPAEIQVMDSKDKTRYTLGGYLSLDELKLIAESIS